MPRPRLLAAPTLAILLVLPAAAAAQEAAALQDPPALDALVAFDRSESDMRVVVDRYTEDRAALLRRWDIPLSPVRRERLRDFYEGWREALRGMDFDALNHEGRVDYVLLRNRLAFELDLLEQEAATVRAVTPVVPYARTLERLQEARREREDVDARAAADTLSRVAGEVEALTRALTEGGSGAPDVSSVVAERAARHVEARLDMLDGWYANFAGYDPLFTWWAPQPYERLTAALEGHAEAIRSHYVGDTPDRVVTGDPIGEEGLRAHLANEMIPYTAAELIAVAEAEFAWMEEELVRASREMGFGDDWRAAQEAVKSRAVEPGRKPAVVRELERESVAFVEARGWIDIPPLAREIWRMEMMSPERQRVAPFFLGGEVILISYPTDAMTHEEKLMSMRGNNPHFNRATVHHELIPGHHLQGFMTDRFSRHRDVFSTPFWTEGWSLYWEILLWENDFAVSPEDRIGMLFWRMHRAARIIFSLSYHLGRMTPEEAVDFLVDRVGHERANAEAEVRRSFAGDYSPLYQAAYMLGGFQFRSLHRELVESGRMSAPELHQAVLEGGRMPVEMVRARLTDQPLTRDYTSRWRFAEVP